MITIYNLGDYVILKFLRRYLFLEFDLNVIQRALNSERSINNNNEPVQDFRGSSSFHYYSFVSYGQNMTTLIR